MDMNTAVSLLNIKEDLLDDEVNGFDSIPITKECNPVNSTRKTKPTRTKKNKADLNTYERLLVSALKKLGYTANELTTWLNQIQNTPEEVQHNALRLMTKHGLDPFADEIAIHQYEDGHWHAFITTDGWSKLINGHPAFNGISFTESTELVNGTPTWMGCAIYRNDRVVPIEIKEYLCEIQTEHSIWKDMPRRMLRHRVVAQCARLAFGVSVPENKNLNLIKSNRTVDVHKLQSAKIKISQTEKLKAYLK